MNDTTQEIYKKTFRDCVLENAWFKVLSMVSFLLIIASFILPPTGIIDNSVLAASGELMGWGALYSVILAIQKGKSVEMKHGETTITVRKREEGEEPVPPMDEE